MLSTFVGAQALRIEFHRRKESGEVTLSEESDNSIFWAVSFLNQIKLEYVSNYLSSECSWNRDRSGHGVARYLSFVSCSET